MENVTKMYNGEKMYGAVVANRNKFEKESDGYSFGEAMYEAGMTEVIKEMAATVFNGSRNEKSTSQKEAFEEAKQIYHELRLLLNEDQQIMLFDLFDKMESVGAHAEESGFIEGYFNGYKFVKGLV